MGFEKFGTVSFTSETKAAEFFEISRRRENDDHQMPQMCHNPFPPKMDCGVCGASEVDWIEIGGLGNLVAYSP